MIELRQPGKRHVLRRASTSAGIAVAIALGAALPASATYYSGGMPTASFGMRVVGINGTWTGWMDTGRTRWNNTSSPANLARNSQASPTFTASRYSQSWYGLYNPSGVIRKYRSFSIKINARTIDRDTSTSANFQTIAKGTITHEMGHALSLADNPKTSSASLMKHNRDRYRTVLPTSYDVADVNRIY